MRQPTPRINTATTPSGIRRRSAIRWGARRGCTFDERGYQLSRTLPLGVQTAGDPDDFTETFQYDDLGRPKLHGCERCVRGVLGRMVA